MLVRFLVVHICISLEKEVKIPITMASFSALSLLCFFLAIVGFGFVRVFVAGIVGGFLSLSSHRYRVEADLSPSPATWNKQDGEGLCTFFVGFQQVCLWIFDFGESSHI